MIISNENSFPVILDNLMCPLITTHFWTLDLKRDDFFLKKLVSLTQFNCALLTLNINNYIVYLPIDWYLLIYSSETSQLDLVRGDELTHGRFTAAVYNHKLSKMVQGEIRVVDFALNQKFLVPSFVRTEMICHALGHNSWCMMTNIDVYNRHIKGKLVGDFT